MTTSEAAVPSGKTVRIFGSPSRYVQGDGVVDLAGEQMVALGHSRCAVHLGQLSLSPENTGELAPVIEAALAFPFMANMALATMPTFAQVIHSPAT